MGNEFGEIFWWALGALIVGFVLGWLYWRGRVWFVRRNRHEQEIAQLTGKAQGHMSRIGELTGELETKQAALANLEGRLADSATEVERLETIVTGLQAVETEAVGLRSRVAELEGVTAEVDALQARLVALEPSVIEANDLRVRLGEIEGVATEAAGLRARVAELEGATSEMDTLRARLSDLEVIEDEAAGLRTRIGQMEAIEAEAAALRSRVAELEGTAGEVDTLRARLTELETIETEARDLRGRLAGFADLEAEAAGLRTRIGQMEAIETEAAGLRGRVAELEGMSAEAAILRDRIAELEAEAGGLRARVGELEHHEMEAERLRLEVERLETANGDGLPAPEFEQPALATGFASAPAVPDVTEPSLDMSAAAAVLGRRIKQDDLTVVEGIGPKISGLLNDDGIATWRGLSNTTPDHIKGLLETAGPRYQMHDPGTWPEQAGLLADGRWEDFAALTEVLDGGVRVGEPTRATGVASMEPRRVELDLAAGAGVLGFRLRRDDLKVVEGIGPQIERLMKDAGIDTWEKLAQAEPTMLERILDEAGPRFRIHDPGTWPRQAGLLAGGRWDDFKVLTDGLEGGRAT